MSWPEQPVPPLPPPSPWSGEPPSARGGPAPYPRYGPHPPYGYLPYPPYGYPPYPPYPYPYSGGPTTDSGAVAVLVLGVASFAASCLGVVPAIIALCLAPGALRRIEESQGTLTGEGYVKAGRILAIVYLAMVVLGLVVVVLLLWLGPGTGDSSDTVITLGRARSALGAG